MPLTIADLLGVEASMSGLLGNCDDWVVCHVPGRPVAKGRPKASTRGGKVRMFTPETTVRGEAWVRQCWLDQVGQLLMTGPLEVRLRILAPRPKSMRRAVVAMAGADQVRPLTKPDLDNVGKLALDALNGIAWFDDSQVVRLAIDKCYAPDLLGPALWLAVREWAPSYRDWLD